MAGGTLMMKIQAWYRLGCPARRSTSSPSGPYGPGSFPKPYLPGENGPGDPLG